MKKTTQPVKKNVSAKDLRATARNFLEGFIRGESLDFNRMTAALQVLVAPDRRGE
jgi:hypothetical protein